MRLSLISRTGLRSVRKLVDERRAVAPRPLVVHLKLRDHALSGIVLQHIEDDRAFVAESRLCIREYIAGIVAFQPSDGTTFEALDVLQIRFTVAGGTVTPDGDPTTLLTMATANTPVAMLADPEDRLWVGVSTATGTTFVVLGRKPD